MSPIEVRLKEYVRKAMINVPFFFNSVCDQYRLKKCVTNRC